MKKKNSTTSPRVLVDSSIWIEAFRRSHSPVVESLIDLLDRRRVVTTGLVMAEVLYGCRNDAERLQVDEAMRGLPFLETGRTAWEAAGNKGALLRGKGITLPLSDLLMAAVASEASALIFSSDHHFDLIPDLKLFKPD